MKKYSCDTVQNVPLMHLASLHAPIWPAFEHKLKLLYEQGDFIQGMAVRSFEKALAKYLNVPYVVTCGNGTDALLIAYLTLGLQRGDRIIIPAFNYIAAAEAAVLLGLEVIYADVDPQTYNLSGELLEPLLEQYKPKACVSVSLFGLPVPRVELYELCKQYACYLIEDQAQSLGAPTFLPNGEQTMHHADISTTSFFPSKNLGALGDGGALYMKDESLYAKSKAIANHGQLKKYEHRYVGLNSRLDSIQALFLEEKLFFLDAFNTERQKNAAIYASLGTLGEDRLESINFSLPRGHIYHQYTIRVKRNLRDMLKNFLLARGIQTMIYYPMPIYRQEAYRNSIPTHCAHAEMLCNEVLSLPICASLATTCIEKTVTAIVDFFNRH